MWGKCRNNSIIFALKSPNMSELKIHVEDQYLPALLSYLQSLSYIRVEQIKEKKGSKQKQTATTATNATERYLASLSPNDPMRQAIKPMRENVTADDLVRESGYVKTDLRKLRQLAIDMDIPQSAEELIAQLRP
jgi:vacuolar-type H+-ATPase subunit I/STV1